MLNLTDTSEENTSENNASAASHAEVPDLTRRNLFKLAVGAGALSLAAPKETLAADALPPPVIYPPSPPVLAWQESIPEYVYKPKAPVDELAPPPQETSNTAFGECGRNAIQGWDKFYTEGNHDTYEFHVKEQLHVFNPAYPAQNIWGFDGVYPGPTIHARYGRTNIVRIFNELPQNHVGFGTPEISMHLHNLHTPGVS